MKYGLCGVVWSKDLSRAHRVAGKIKVFETKIFAKLRKFSCFTDEIHSPCVSNRPAGHLFDLFNQFGWKNDWCLKTSWK